MDRVKNWKTDQLIVGGGIIGLCTAYYLVEAGHEVVIVDKGPRQEAASHGNCGLISPSHALPLNNPKLIAKALLWTLQPNAPFYIKPRFDTHLLGWMTKFVMNANHSSIHQSMLARYRLMESSKQLYGELITHHELDCSWQEDGILFVCKKEKTFEDLGNDIAYTQREIGLSADSYIGKDLIRKEPAIRDDVYGAWLYQVDGHLKSDDLIKGLTKILEERGVRFLHGQEVRGISKLGNRLTEVQTNSESIVPNNLILCSGAMSPLLLKELKIKVPVIPGKGYSITMKSPENAPKIPCIFQERKTVATPWHDKGYRLGGTMELSGYSKGLNNKRLQALKDAGREYLKNPYSDTVYEEWWGWRSMTPDGVPIIDRAEGFQNLYLAFGHNMLGMSMGPATGKMLAEMIQGKPTHVDNQLYKLNRF